MTTRIWAIETRQPKTGEWTVGSDHLYLYEEDALADLEWLNEEDGGLHRIRKYVREETPPNNSAQKEVKP